MENNIVYNNGEIELKVSVDSDTVWLTQKQLSELFEVTKQNISLHIIEIFKTNELSKSSTVKKYLTVQKEGNREVSRNVEHYNLDMIISIGYRVNSKQATKFRQWATSILKQYITNGYIINSEKITHDRFISLENKVEQLSYDIKILKTKDISSQGIFFDGEVFNAYTFINDLIKTAKKEIILIDNYIDDTTFTLFCKITNIKVTIYTSKIDKQLKLDIEEYKKQYNNLEVKIFKNSHDRFLIIDNTQLYNIGASLKDVGKKWFAFSKLDISFINNILQRLG